MKKPAHPDMRQYAFGGGEKGWEKCGKLRQKRDCGRTVESLLFMHHMRRALLCVNLLILYTVRYALVLSVVLNAHCIQCLH